MKCLALGMYGLAVILSGGILKGLAAGRHGGPGWPARTGRERHDHSPTHLQCLALGVGYGSGGKFCIDIGFCARHQVSIHCDSASQTLLWIDINYLDR